MAQAQSVSTDKVFKTVSGTKCKVRMFVDQKDGDVDWNEVGEMGIENVIKETKAVKAVDFKFGDGQKDKPTQASEWQYVHEKYDIMVFKKVTKGSPRTIFIGRGVIDVPLVKVAEFLKDVNNNITWDNFLIEVKCVKVLSETDKQLDYIGYQRFESTKCFVQTNRDLLYFVRCLYKDDVYIQAGVSVDDPDYVIPNGLKRVEVFMGSGWYLEPFNGNPNQTLVTYIGNTDLKGIPYFMMNLVLKRHPLALRYIRYQLTSTPRRDSISSEDESEIELTIRESALQGSIGSSVSRYQDSLPVGEFLKR